MKTANKCSLISLPNEDTVYPSEIGSAVEKKLRWLIDIPLGDQMMHITLVYYKKRV